MSVFQTLFDRFVQICESQVRYLSCLPFSLRPCICSFNCICSIQAQVPAGSDNSLLCGCSAFAAGDVLHHAHHAPVCISTVSADLQAHTFKQPVYEDDQDQEQCPDEALFKTRMCIYFLQGRCQRGSTCSFAHDPAELQAYNPARRYAQQVALLLLLDKVVVAQVDTQSDTQTRSVQTVPRRADTKAEIYERCNHVMWLHSQATVTCIWDTLPGFVSHEQYI